MSHLSLKARLRTASRFITRYRHEETGSGTISSVFLIAIMAVVAGAAIDGANGWRARNQLQVTADSAALAAAAHVDDFTQARMMAKEVSQRMLHGDTSAMGDADIRFGFWNSDEQKFYALADDAAPEDYNAVYVTASRDSARQNSVGTYLMRLVGINSLDVRASSIAMATIETGTRTVVDPDAGSGCADTTIMTTANVAGGGGSTYMGDVCIYGATGVSFGGNDYFHEDSRVMAKDESTINLGYTRNPNPNDAEAIDRITTEGTMTPAMLPLVDAMHAQLYSHFEGMHGQTYGGALVPDFVKDPATGVAKVVVKDWSWWIQPGQVEPYTIYVLKGGGGFSGGIDAKNVAFIVNGQLGIGGGPALHFDDVFFIADTLNFAGNVEYGRYDDVCGEDPHYTAYLLAKNSISLGGWSPSDGKLWGVVVAAPTVQPGGAMSGSRIYVEASTTFNVGGAFNLQGCTAGEPSSYWQLADRGTGGTTTETYKIRKAKLRK